MFISSRRGEHGQPLRLTTIRALAQALQVEPEDLMAQPTRGLLMPDPVLFLPGFPHCPTCQAEHTN